MTTDRSPPAPSSVVWPYLVWSVQLAPALLLVAYSTWRLRIAGEAQLGITGTVFGLSIGTLWATGVLLMLVIPRGRRWLVARRKDWALSFASVLFAVVLFDIGLNLVGMVPTIEAQRNRSISYSMGRFAGYRLIPQRVEAGHSTVVVNSRGFRGAEIDPDKPKGRVRIAFLGESQVFDYNGIDWPTHAGELLRGRGLDVDTINAGVPGYNSTDGLAVLLTDLWVLRPDVVFACHGWNDFKYYSRVGPGAPYRGLPPKKPLPWLLDWRTHPRGLDNLMTASALYRHFRWGLAQFLFHEEGLHAFSAYSRDPDDPNLSLAQSWGPRQYAMNLELMATLAKQLDVTLVLCRQAYLRAGTTKSGADALEYALGALEFKSADEFEQAYDGIRATVADVARRHQLTIIDMHAPLATQPAYFWDAVHFTPEGSRAAAAVAAEGLEPLIRARLATSHR